MAKNLRLGIVGMSDGNGHPYSWSAIFNGYNTEVMAGCPFPVIPEYLSKQNFPQDGLSHLGIVTHIWTQDKSISKHIAEASNIKYVTERMQDMIGSVDAVLLARDDAEKHYEMAWPFIKEGLPIFIDKPLALTLCEANRILSSEIYQGQIFTCSSLRFAPELFLSNKDRSTLGPIYYVEGSIMKKWDTYAVHLLEPFISQLPGRGKLKQVKSIFKNNIRAAMIEWENLSGFFKTTGDVPSSLEYKFYGRNGNITKQFSDSFACFKASLEKFIKVIADKNENIQREETLEIVEIIEKVRSI